MPFQLHPQLAADCAVVGDFPLSRLLLMNESRYPWCILVPRRVDLTELFQLDATDRRQLLDESCLLAETLSRIHQPDKLNIAAIGNLVPQLHVHHVARRRTDAAWPAPVWGKFPPQPYLSTQLQQQIAHLQQALSSQGLSINAE
jgi:diadenosine tetraphosphate (Ap4A) HIT family hydrolase